MSDLFWDNRHWTMVNCCKCAVEFMVPAGFDSKRREDKAPFWCPNGHQQAYVRSEADKLRQERDRLKQQMARVEDEKREAEERARKAEAATARVKKRATAGMCPHCRRSFANMARHMACCHAEEILAAGGTVIKMPKRKGKVHA